jgi:ABC-2 type transport system ATP-binding protein
LIINKGRIVVEDTPEQLQSRLAGAQRFKIQVKGDNDGLEALIRGMVGIISIKQQVDGGLEIESIPGQDPRPEIARRIIGEGYDLLELRSIGLSLEDIFLELTREEPAVPEMREYGEEETEDLEIEIRG